MSAVVKLRFGWPALTGLEACPLARAYGWHAPIEDWARRKNVRDADEQLYARPVLRRERMRTPDDELREQIRQREAEAQARRIAETPQVQPQPQKEEEQPSSPTSLLQDTTPGEQRTEEEPSRTDAPPPSAASGQKVLGFPATRTHNMGRKPQYDKHQRVSSPVNVSDELKHFLENQQHHDERALEDTIRRLCGLHPRTPR